MRLTIQLNTGIIVRVQTFKGMRMASTEMRKMKSPVRMKTRRPQAHYSPCRVGVRRGGEGEEGEGEEGGG